MTFLDISVLWGIMRISIILTGTRCDLIFWTKTDNHLLSMASVGKMFAKAPNTFRVFVQLNGAKTFSSMYFGCSDYNETACNFFWSVILNWALEFNVKNALIRQFRNDLVLERFGCCLSFVILPVTKRGEGGIQLFYLGTYSVPFAINGLTF